MPTSKPRITVTLSERQHAVLRSLSKNSGQSMSAYIAELLELVLPTLERMAATMQALAQSRDGEMQRVREQLDEAQRVFEPLAMAVVAQADMFMERIERAAGAGDGPTAGTSPPPTNRGVTTTPAKPKKPNHDKALRAVRARSRKSKKGGRNDAI
jgi:predicted DNA-binding protein